MTPRKTFIQISSHMSNIVNVSFIRLCTCFYLINNFIMFIIVLKTRDIKKHIYFYLQEVGEFIEMLSCLPSTLLTTFVPEVNQVRCVLSHQEHLWEYKWSY